MCGGHEVDVHALKNKGSKCAESKTVQSNETTKVEAVCATTTKTVSEQVLVGVKHMIGPKGSGRFVLIHPSANSAHYTGKHADDIPVYETVTKTIAVPVGQNCSSTQTQSSTQVTSSSTVTPAAGAPSTPAAASAGAVAGATATPAASAPAASAPAASAPAAASGVKGAALTLHPTKAKPAGGVLGTTTRLGGTVASANLPFTGLPLWIFVAAAALALILTGVALRRTSADRS